MVREEKIFKGFLLWLPWQPEFFMEHNYLKELKEDHLRNIPVKFGKNQDNSFRGEVFFVGKINGRTHNRHNAMTIACWPLASGAKT